MARSARTSGVAAAVVAALVTTVGMVRPQPGGAAGADTNGPHWVGCGGVVECTSIAVPASYGDPEGPQLSIAVARVPAADPTRRIGALLVNPGGPGLSAVDAIDGMAASLPAAVTARFDVVAVDPRGVGRSAPVDCGVPLDPVFDRSFAPTTESERAALVAALRIVADACESRDAQHLREVSTVDTARDMDRVRAALGEDRLTYLGFSYGTLLGSLYAGLFPDRVRALVLDGAVDPTLDARASTLLQAGGFEAGLDAFLEWCSVGGECALGAGGDAAREYDALRARISAAALAVAPEASGRGTGAPRALNDTRFDAAVLLHLYRGRAGWPALAAALADASDGNGERLLRAADRFLGRQPGGGDDGSVEAFWAVGCLDDPTAAGVGDLQARAEARAPRLGAFVANFSLACSVWPTRGTGSSVVPVVRGAAPAALVVGSTNDPATPLAAAKRLARLLGDAPLVVAAGDRHTAVGSGNDCVDQAVAGYLLRPEAPVPARRRC